MRECGNAKLPRDVRSSQSRREPGPRRYGVRCAPPRPAGRIVTERPDGSALRVQRRELPSQRAPRALERRRHARRLQCGIHAPRRAHQRAAGEHRRVGVVAAPHDLLVERRVVGERGEREPRFQIALRVGRATGSVARRPSCPAPRAGATRDSAHRAAPRTPRRRRAPAPVRPPATFTPSARAVRPSSCPSPGSPRPPGTGTARDAWHRRAGR